MTEMSMDRVSTGVAGLDEVLGGGLPRGRLILLQGAPGVGKTTLALQFLLAGQKNGERCLYAGLTETRREVESVAKAHGWSVDGLTIWDGASAAQVGKPGSQQTMFHPAEVELEELTRPMFDELERINPTRVVIDSLSEIRLLARERLRYRRHLLALKQFFEARDCTVVLIDTIESHEGVNGGILETIIGGLILLEKSTPVFGSSRRRLLVDKMRAIRFSEGFHDFQIRTGGVEVFPRLVASEHVASFPSGHVSSGLPALDALVGGGLERGTSTLLIGAAGTGKSSLATQYAVAAAERGEKSVIYAFEETLATWVTRSISLGFDVKGHIEAGRIKLVHVDPAELTPGEFSTRVREAVERDGVRVVVIDSLNGYLQSVPEETHLLLHLHELLTYLGQQGATTIMNVAQHGVLGPSMVTPIDVSYLADCVMMLRYFETNGEVRQAISVVKKRSGQHERTIREFQLDGSGIRVGRPLRDFHGVLTGVPTYRGADGPLMNENK